MRTLLEKFGLRADGFIKVRTPYSFRHSHIMQRVVQPGARLPVLARNWGTSLAMMEKYYASHIDVMAHRDTLSRPPGPDSDTETRRVTEAARELAEMVRAVLRRRA
jgi:hypothetical protein